MSVGFQEWVGRQRQTRAYIDPWRAQAMAAVLDTRLELPETQLPGLWHWLYFLEAAPQSRIGADGHPLKGDFLPPVANPRRMFAGARTEYLKPLEMGAEAELLETLRSVTEKTGSQGRLYIVSVEYEYRQHGVVCLREVRDFIYLPAVTQVVASDGIDLDEKTLPGADWSLDFSTDAVRLMRFSALTFNSHRIHYDSEYANTQEGYPGLVVHGPLTAMLLSELCRLNSSRRITRFNFRARAPLFSGQTVRSRGNLMADGAELTAWRPDGEVAVSAQATFE